MAFKQTPGLIADAFSGSFRQKLAEVQEQEQFNRKMYEEQRQQGLIEYWRQQNFKADEAWRQSQLKSKETDDLRQQNYNDAQIANMEADNQRNLEKDAYQKEQDKKKLAIDQQRLSIDQQKLQTQQQGGIWKGFGDYAVKKSKLLQTTLPAPEIDKDGKKTGNWIDTSKTPGEIKQGLLELRGYAVSKLPPAAQNFYVSNFLDKKASKLAFHANVKKAFLSGQLSENDANALLDFNELRTDWGEVPQVPKQKITRPNK